MAAAHDALLSASPWVKRFAPQIPQGSVVLDLACGAGRHAIYLAQLGFSVLAVDQDVSALEKSKTARVETRALDLEGNIWPIPDAGFGAIVVTNYLHRPYLDRLPEMLGKGGLLIYETFAQGNAQFGKPSNPDFLLNSGELLALASRHALQVLAYEDIYTDEPKPAMVQRLCALKEA